jgi:hypothetical protein
VLPFPLRACLQVLLASAVMGALLYPVRQHVGAIALSAQIVAGAMAYGGVLLGCNFLELRDQLLRKFVQRRGREYVLPDVGVGAPAGTLVEAQ